MAAPAKVILNGLRPTLTDWNFLDSVSGPDEITFTAKDCSARNTYMRGMAVPGYTNCRIVEARARLVPGPLYDITCRARGLLDSSSRVISRRDHVTAEGWDEINERRMELKALPVPVFGSNHSGYTSMRYLDGGTEESLDLGDGTSHWCLRDRVYRGIISAGSKLVFRVITVNENIVSPSDPLIVSLPGGWSTPKKSQISMPRVVVTDTVVTNIPPPTDGLPGNLTPVDPPLVRVFSLSAPTLTYNWPNGWKLASINSQELYRGAGLYRNSIVFEFVPYVQF